MGPDLAEAGDNEFEDRGGVVMGPNIGRPQVGDEQLGTTENVKGQEVVAVEEACSWSPWMGSSVASKSSVRCSGGVAWEAMN